MISVLVHIVDDDHDTAEELGRLFTDNGIEHLIFTDPESFLKSEGKKRLCVIDYRFQNSGMTGLDVAEAVMIQNGKCQIIIVTGFVNDSNILELINLKAFKYLSKMKDNFMDDLLKYVKQAIKIVEGYLIKEEEDKQIMEFAKKKNIR